MTNADGRAGEAAELRIGLIGAGKMGLQHVKAITAQTGTRVIGVADPAADPARLAESLPAGCQVVKTAAELIALRPDVVHIVTPPATPHGAGAAGDPRRLPRLHREAVHADPCRRGGHLRRRGGARAAGLRRASVPVRGAVAGGARVAGRDRRRRPHRELLLVPHGPPHDHAGRPGQGHPAARGLSAGRAAARRHPAAATRSPSPASTSAPAATSTRWCVSARRPACSSSR